MGRIPPPPPPGAMLILEPGTRVEYIDVTCIDDPEPRFIPRWWGGVEVDRTQTYPEWVAEQQARQAVADAAQRVVVRDNMVGAGLMLAALLASLAALWSVL